MRREVEICKEEFMALQDEEIRRIVLDKNTPKVGIFVADGSRRLIMCRTRLEPTTDEFHLEYARFFLNSLKESLAIFFSHGLQTLFFPLVGPSVPLRENKYQTIAISTVIQQIFQSNEWLQFYKENGIRVKTYGDLSHLKKINPADNMAEGITRTTIQTASHNMHTLLVGFMSENTPGLEMPQQVIDFYKSQKRPPGPQEMIELYFGEIISPADFIIFSSKLSGHGALPPFISTQKAKMYFFPVPAFLALNKISYRKILYDLLFIQPLHSTTGYINSDLKNIERLSEYYQYHKNTILGTGKKIGNFLVPNI